MMLLMMLSISFVIIEHETRHDNTLPSYLLPSYYASIRFMSFRRRLRLRFSLRHFCFFYDFSPRLLMPCVGGGGRGRRAYCLMLLHAHATCAARRSYYAAVFDYLMLSRYSAIRLAADCCHRPSCHAMPYYFRRLPVAAATIVIACCLFCWRYAAAGYLRARVPPATRHAATICSECGAARARMCRYSVRAKVLIEMRRLLPRLMPFFLL